MSVHVEVGGVDAIMEDPTIDLPVRLLKGDWQSLRDPLNQTLILLHVFAGASWWRKARRTLAQAIEMEVDPPDEHWHKVYGEFEVIDPVRYARDALAWVPLRIDLDEALVFLEATPSF